MPTFLVPDNRCKSRRRLWCTPTGPSCWCSSNWAARPGRSNPAKIKKMFNPKRGFFQLIFFEFYWMQLSISFHRLPSWELFCRAGSVSWWSWRSSESRPCSTRCSPTRCPTHRKDCWRNPKNKKLKNRKKIKSKAIKGFTATLILGRKR